MPATFAHPVFALLFARARLPLSALVIGAMAPDVAYLIPWPIPHAFRHNITGIFAFALPAGLAFLWLYHRVIKIPAARFLTRRLQARLTAELAPFSFGPLPRFALICAALIVGAATHVFVDELTHLRGWPVQEWSFMRAVVLRTPWEGVRLYSLLQLGGTIAGSAVLLWKMRDHLKALVPTRADPGRLPRIVAMVVSAAICALVYAALSSPDDEGFRGIKIFVVRFVASGLVLSFLLVVLDSASWHARRMIRG